MKKSTDDHDRMINIEPEIISLRNKYTPIYSVLSIIMCMFAGISAYVVTSRTDGKDCLIFNIILVCVVALVFTLLKYVVSVIEDVHCSSRYKDICREKR